MLALAALSFSLMGTMDHPAHHTTGSTCVKTDAAPLKMKWNAYASEWGAYEIEGCDGVNPKLSLAAGATYTFDQSDATNWYHPVGFSYIAGGAHTVCSGEECPELGGVSEGSAHSGTASILQYYVNGVAVSDDESGFGLDAYEPEFFNSQGWWGERATPYKVTLEIPADVTYTRIYYFCHIHGGMSAEIEITGSSVAEASRTVIDTVSLGTMSEAEALAIYTGIVEADQPEVVHGSFDDTCGTTGAVAFDPAAAHSTCSGKNFLCGDGASTQYADCLKAIDCKMHHDMAISVPAADTSQFATFARQMIPHHQNAVQMAKVLLKHGGSADYPADGTEDQDKAWAEGLAREIINVQNFQIQSMSGWLEANAGISGESTMCYAGTTDPITSGATATPATAPAAIQTGVACDKTASSATTLNLKWNPHASEWGAYEVEGCTGVNPKLSLTAGTEYTWDQSDATNWYHPVGFSYIAGGAHTECMSSEGAGECPELGGEAAGSTLQYYVRGVAVTSDESSFGLDAYEPEFFNSQGWWGEQSPGYKVTLTIPTTATYTRIYYFCHIHAGMSAEIEVVGGAGGNVIDPASLGTMSEAEALAIYTGIVSAEQKAIGTYDQTCGTHNAAGAPVGDICGGAHFLCGAGASTQYADCLKAIDCKMHNDMAISIPSATTSKFATFARQMIPHHQNAVSMAKVLLKNHVDADYPAEGTEDQDKAWAEGLAREIINVQNFQIQIMQGWLEANAGISGVSGVCNIGSGTIVGIAVGGGVAALGLIVVAAMLVKSMCGAKSPEKKGVANAAKSPETTGVANAA
jgi:uncharacterized protein (DUF305 family)